MTTTLLQKIDDEQLDATTKGVPLAGGSIRLGDVGRQGWNVARGDMMLPLLVLRDSNLRNNLETMKRFAQHHGVSLAPHGKSSFCPQLYRDQVDVGGSWGITAATVQQAALVAASGIDNILIANEVVGRANIEQLVALRHALPKVKLYSLVDSLGAMDQLSTYGGPKLKPGERFQVLLEVGFPGGRAGVRTREDGIAMVRALAERKEQFDFVGIECYEGLVTAPTPEATIKEVDRLLDLASELYFHAYRSGAFGGRAETILTAGGSAYYDRVVERFREAQTVPGTRVILRGGSCLTYDHGFYSQHLAELDARGGLDMPGGRKKALEAFTPALELWAAVVSMQDRGIAVMNMGIRDLPYDLGLPVPLRQYRDGKLLRELQAPGTPYVVTKSNDQHCYMTYPEGADLKIGDLVAFGISHPCTAFDKWNVVYRVDDKFNVTSAIKTFF
jgi:D-serine dehydratase